MSTIPNEPGLYAIGTPAGTYYGESDNLFRRRASHWKRLMVKRHHCILLRRVVCEFGPESLTFTVISSGPQWKDKKLRVEAELIYIRGREDSLNTKGNEKTYATQLRLPPKAKYVGRRVYVEFRNMVIKVREERHGNLIGLERTKGKLASGYYDVDERGFINASPNVRRVGSARRPPGEVRADRAGARPALRSAVP